MPKRISFSAYEDLARKFDMAILVIQKLTDALEDANKRLKRKSKSPKRKRGKTK